MHIQEKHRNPIAAPFELFEYLDGIQPSVGKMGGRRYTTKDGTEKSLNTLYSDCIGALHMRTPKAEVKHAVITRLSELDKRGTEELQKASRWIRLLTIVKQCLTLSPLIRAIQQYRLSHIEVQDSGQNIPEIASISKLKTMQNAPSVATLQAIMKEADALKTIMMQTYGYGAGHEHYKDVHFIFNECRGLQTIEEINGDADMQKIWNTFNEELQGTLRDKLQEAAERVVKTRDQLAKWTESQKQPG